MKNNLLTPVKCPCCGKAYIINCQHPETGSEAENAEIQYIYYDLEEKKQ